MTRDISSYHMMQVTFILRHGSDRNHCLFHQSTVHTAAISKACGQLTEIIVFFCLFFCLFVCFYQSTRQPYWKLVDFWLKSSCVPSVNNPHGGHIESLWISDWNHRVFIKSTVHTTAISKACEDVAMSETLVICKTARGGLIGLVTSVSLLFLGVFLAFQGEPQVVIILDQNIKQNWKER